MLLILLLTSLMLLVLLGFYVLVLSPTSATNRTFTTFLASLALWTVKDILVFGFAPRSGSGNSWAVASFLIALALQYSLSLFAWAFPDSSKIPRRSALILLAPGIVLIPAIFMGWLWSTADFQNGHFSIVLTPAAYLFGVYIYGLFAICLLILTRKYRTYRGSLKGKQLGAILCALTIIAFLMSTANVIFPIFGNYDFLPLSSIFVLPGVVIVAFAISNFRLFSFQSALDQFRLFPIAYKVALSIAVVAVTSFAVLQVPIVWWTFGSAGGVYAWKRYLVYSVISALVPNLILVALIIRTISRPIRRVTEAAVAVAGGGYGAQVDLSSNDEFGLLAGAFNEMSRKMAADIEHLRNMNDQLIRTERLAAAGTLAAGVAHEVNNPLASISSLVQILQSGNRVDSETREMLGLVSAQVTRISNVLKEMMNFASVETSVRSSVDLRNLLESSIRLATFDKGFRLIELSVEQHGLVPNVDVDADQIQQVFLNLLLNAKDAMPEGGKLRLDISREMETGFVKLEISDTGRGIRVDDLERIFDPFFTTKPAGTGTGLGLAVCSALINAHGGAITAESNAGGGAKFTVRLPSPAAANGVTR